MKTSTGTRRSNRARWLTAVLSAVLALVCVAPAAHAQSAWDHYQKALEFQNGTDLEGARRELQKAVDKDSQNAFYHAALGLVLFNMSDCARAKPELKRALELDNKILDAHTALGTCYTVESDYESAIEQFDASLALNPPDKGDVATLYNNLGEIHSILGKADKAEEYLLKAKQADPELVTTHINLGNMYTTRKEYDKAVAAYQKAIELAPEYALAHNNLAFACISMENFDCAQKELDAALRIDPNNAYYKENREYVKWAMQEPEKYEEGKLKGLPKEVTLRPQGKRETPRQPTNGVDVAMVVDKENAADATAQPAETTIAVPAETPAETPAEQPAEQPAETNVAVAQQPSASELTTPDNNPPAKTPEKTPEKAPAEKPVDKTMIKPVAQMVTPAMAGPSDQDLAAMYYKGALYNLNNGDLGDARRDISRALNQSPSNADFLAALGFIEIRSGQLMQAMTQFDAALKSNPNHAVSLAALGYINDMLGEHAVAEDKYKAAVGASPALGCAIAGLATARVRRAECDEQTQALFVQAQEDGCFRGEMLNNQAFCSLKNSKEIEAHTLGYKALQRSPDDATVRENFNFLTDVTGLPFNVVKDQDMVYDPYFRVARETDILPLEMFLPVAAVDFYNVFVTTWQNKTVLVVPFENPRGTERWNPTPSEVYTTRMAVAIDSTGFFNATLPHDNTIYSYDELTRGGMLKTLVQRNPADLIFVTSLQRTELNNVTRDKYLGLKKDKMVSAATTMPTLILDGVTLQPIYNGPITGSVDVADKLEAEVGYRKMEQIKEDVFGDYADTAMQILMQHFYLLRHPVDKQLVKHLPQKDLHASQYH